MQSENLITRIKKNDPQAFGDLVESFKDRVYNTCLGMVHHDDDAMDLSQEVFLEVYKSLDGFRGEAKLSTWIYRIAVTKSLEHLRKAKRKKRFAFLSSLTGSESESVSTAQNWVHPGVQLENKERAGILFQSIEKLPDNQRIAFTMHKVEGLSYQEVSEIMKVSVSSIESLMFRARKNLKKYLHEYYQNS